MATETASRRPRLPMPPCRSVRGRDDGRRMANGLLVVAVVAAVVGVAAPARAAEEMAVVVSRDNPNVVDAGYIAKIYEGALRAWPDGSPVLALDQPEDSKGRAAFSSVVLKRSVANMRALWSQNIFTGKGLPPKIVGQETDLRRHIATDRRAIGYIATSQVDDSLRVLFTWTIP